MVTITNSICYIYFEDEDKGSIPDKKDEDESRELQRSVTQQLIKSKQLDRKRVTFQSTATKLIANQDVTSGLTVDDENEDKGKYRLQLILLELTGSCKRTL